MNIRQYITADIDCTFRVTTLGKYDILKNTKYSPSSPVVFHLYNDSPKACDNHVLEL